MAVAVTWSSSDTQVASVSSDAQIASVSSETRVASVSSVGVVTAVGNGEATITATAGTVSAAVQVVVRQVITSLSFDDPVETIDLEDQPLELEVLEKDANGYLTPLEPIQWSSSDPSVLTVDSRGTVTPVSVGVVLISATMGPFTARTAIHVVAPDFPDAIRDMRAIHIGGNWLGNRLWAGQPPEEFWQFVESLNVNWVGISVAPPRWLIGQPWLELDFTAEEWPWLLSHPDHEEFVAAFWGSYTEQAVHIARIAGEESAALFSLGTESDRLFRTRTEGPWITEFGDEIRTMVGEVRNVFAGLITYDQVYETLVNDFFGLGNQMLWEDGGFDVIGISAYFRLLGEEPTSVTSVATLQESWESVLRDVLLPVQQANPNRPIMFTEFAYVSDVRAPANPTVEEFEDEVFLDTYGNLLDDGEEVQANIYEALFRALEVYPVVDAAFLWDHATDAAAEIEHESPLRSSRVRGKLAEAIVRRIYGGSN